MTGRTPLLALLAAVAQPSPPEPPGRISGHTIATTDDGLTTVVIDFTWSGTYEINPDGTGTVPITMVEVADDSFAPVQPAGQCATFEGPESYAFVLNRHGEEKLVSLIQTDNEGGGAKVFLPRFALSGSRLALLVPRALDDKRLTAAAAAA